MVSLKTLVTLLLATHSIGREPGVPEPSPEGLLWTKKPRLQPAGRPADLPEAEQAQATRPRFDRFGRFGLGGLGVDTEAGRLAMESSEQMIRHS